MCKISQNRSYPKRFIGNIGNAAWKVGGYGGGGGIVGLVGALQHGQAPFSAEKGRITQVASLTVNQGKEASYAALSILSILPIGFRGTTLSILSVQRRPAIEAMSGNRL